MQKSVITMKVSPAASIASFFFNARPRLKTIRLAEGGTSRMPRWCTSNLTPKRSFPLFQSGLDRLLGQWAHDGIALGVGMQAVVADVGLEQAFVVDGGREIVEIDVAMISGVFLDPGV